MKPTSKTSLARPTETLLYQPVYPGPDAVRVGWMYPYTYGVSMSSLGYLSLFKQLDQHPDVAVRRINTDDMHEHGLGDMELMGFSFSFELDVLEILKMIRHYELAPYAADRPNSAPLLFAGGPVVMTNPEPYADFFDFFLIGEGEGLMDNLITAFKQYRHLSRAEKLKALALNVPGVYVPSLYDITYEPGGEITGIHPKIDGLPMPVEKQLMAEMENTVCSTPILTEASIFSNTFLVEVMRGCAHRCRFCLASYSMLPARGPGVGPLLKEIEFGLKHTRKIGLLGALIADHPEFDQICDVLKGIDGVQVSAASLRADTLTSHIAETFKHGGQQNITIAIETGSEKLRKRINKHLKTEAIENAAMVTAQAGIKQLKLYNMVGLPDEDMTDLEATVDLMKRLKKQNPTLKLVFGCSTYVPKAATPFQWTHREDSKTLQNKMEYYRKSLVKLADFRPTSPKWDYIQALLSRGDRRLAPFILAFADAGANLGALNRAMKQFETQPRGSQRGRLEQINQKNLQPFLAKGQRPSEQDTKVSIDLPSLDWYALRERSQDEILPWDLIFLGVPKATLYKESGLGKMTEEAINVGAQR